MGRRFRWISAGLVLALAFGLGAGSAQAGWKTPLWGWKDGNFSLWPILFVGDGGFSVPFIRVTEHSCSIPLVHYQSTPEDRFDLTPLYHYTEGEEGFAVGPRRATVNDGLQGVAGLVYDLLTLGTNTRQFLSDDPESYELYRDYGQPDLILPGGPHDRDESVSLEGKVEAAPEPAEGEEYVPPLEDEVMKAPPADEEKAEEKDETKQERSFEDQKAPETVAPGM